MPWNRTDHGEVDEYDTNSRTGIVSDESVYDDEEPFSLYYRADEEKDLLQYSLVTNVPP